MSEKIVTFVFQFVIHVIDAGGYLGIAGLITLNSCGIPIPSEVIMPFSGALIYFHMNAAGQLVPPGQFGGGNVWLGLFLVAAFGALGCNCGSAIAYWIGARGGRPLVERYGKWVLMSHRDLERMNWFFGKYGSITVLLARMMPVAQSFIAFPAGIARMPRLRFHVYTSIGSFAWYLCLAYAGMKLGVAWHTDPRFQAAFHRFHLGVEVALVAGIAWFVWSHLRRGRLAEAALVNERDAVSAANETE
jgi:membrane protein DedA with SNARE-associated domain